MRWFLLFFALAMFYAVDAEACVGPRCQMGNGVTADLCVYGGSAGTVTCPASTYLAPGPSGRISLSIEFPNSDSAVSCSVPPVFRVDKRVQTAWFAETTLTYGGAFEHYSNEQTADYYRGVLVSGGDSCTNLHLSAQTR